MLNDIFNIIMRIKRFSPEQLEFADGEPVYSYLMYTQGIFLTNQVYYMFLCSCTVVTSQGTFFTTSCEPRCPHFVHTMSLWLPELDPDTKRGGGHASVERVVSRVDRLHSPMSDRMIPQGYAQNENNLTHSLPTLFSFGTLGPPLN